MNLKSLMEQFEKEMRSHAAEIDPNQDYDWFALTLGWSLGRGLSIKEAFEFTLHMYASKRI